MGASKMEMQVIIALIVAIPVILFPAAFLWYINIGGVVGAVKKAWAKRYAGAKENNPNVTTE